MTTNDYNPTPPPWLNRQQEGAGQEQSPQADPFGQPEQTQPGQGHGPQPGGFAPEQQAPAVPGPQAWGGEVPAAAGYPRQEIGTDGTVRRVAFDAPAGQPAFPVPTAQQAPPVVPFDAPAAQQGYQPPQPQPGAPIYTWAPPAQQQPQAPAQPQPTWAERAAQLQPAHRSGKNVNDLSLLKRAKKPPRSGWRLAIHRLSGGAFNPGESPADTIQRELVERVNSPVRGDYRIAILSLKGGVGKTTTTVGLGSTFASLRGDRVIAIDANPDLGTLAHRVPRQTTSTVRDLLDDGNITRYSDVRAHTSQAPSRLEVLASEQDPAVSEAFSEQDYRTAIGILQQFYNIILTDCGTGLMHSAMTGVLDMASSLVLVTSPAIDGARSASATLDWLEHHGYGKLVERTVVVVNASRRGASSVDIDQLRKLFLDRTRAVQVVPFDEHLAEGAEIDLELVNKVTKQALLELAAMVADDFPLTSGRHAG